MSVQFRCRLEKPVLDKANAVTEALGTSTAEMVRVFLTEIARTGAIPVKLSIQKSPQDVLPWETRAEAIERFYDDAKTW